jgi:hypothetical protein
VCDDRLWVGCQSGSLIILQIGSAPGAAPRQVHEGKMHSDFIADVQCLGAHVWTAGGDK